MLRSAGVAGRPESYFRAPDESSWADRWRLPRDPAGTYDYRDYVRAAMTEGTTPNGVFGARLMWGTLDQVTGKLRTVHPDLAGADDLELLTSTFGRTRFIYLWRDDTVAQAVSWARAEQTHYWQPGDTPLAGREPRFDGDQIRRLVQTIDEHNAAWRTWFAAHDVAPHRVRYEDLASDPIGVTSRILDDLGLGLPAGRVIAAPQRRQADDLNQEWKARYAGLSEQPSAAIPRDGARRPASG